MPRSSRRKRASKADAEQPLAKKSKSVTAEKEEDQPVTVPSTTPEATKASKVDNKSTKKQDASKTKKKKSTDPHKPKKLTFRRGGTSSAGFASKKKSGNFIDSKKFASMPAKVRKVLGSNQLFGKHQWKIVRFACEGEDYFTMHGGSNYNADKALELVDNSICTREMVEVADGDYRPYEDGSSGISKKKLAKKPDLKISVLEFSNTMADAEVALEFMTVVGEMLFVFNVPFVFCKGFWKQHLKVASEEAKPLAIAKTMGETPARGAIIGAPDKNFVLQFQEELLSLNEGDPIATAWIKARGAALVAQAEVSADPEGFDLDAGTSEARKLFSDLKALSKQKTYRKDKRFSNLSAWKECGFLVKEDGVSVPGLVLPSTAEGESDDEGDEDEEDEEMEEDGDGGEEEMDEDEDEDEE